jgi:Uma2 family endonuclease
VGGALNGACGGATLARMSNPAQPVQFTAEEYLARERAAETKSEFHDGRIVAMAGGTGPHSQLACGFVRELGNIAKAKGCSVFNSDMKLRIAANNRVCYPDVSGLCGRPEYLDESRDVLLNPSFVIEVLSKSTEACDRGRKLALYMALPSVVEIALVSVVEVRVDKYTRQPDGIWRFDGYSGVESQVSFVSMGSAVSLQEVYAGVELDPPGPEPGVVSLD